MAATLSFRRLVLEVGHAAAGAGALRHAAELARQLDLALHCLLVEDEALFGLPSLPFARELRLPTHDWQQLDAGRLAADFAAMADALRRDLAALSVSHGIAQRLDVRRGDPQECLGGLCGAADIIVLSAGGPQAPRTHQTARLHAMARQSAASVLLLPAAPAAASEARVAVLAANPDDPGIAVAASIAARADAALLVVLSGGDPGAVAARAAGLGVVTSRLTVRKATGGDAASREAALAAALGAGGARLLVMDAAAAGAPDLAARLAGTEGVPVLLVEPRAGISRPA